MKCMCVYIYIYECIYTFIYVGKDGKKNIITNMFISDGIINNIFNFLH